MMFALRVRLRAGAFSGEKVYRLTLADGAVWESLAPRPHCWHPDGRPLAEHEPAEEIDALVACRASGYLSPVTGGAHVWVPAHTDSEFVCVRVEDLVERPQPSLDERLEPRKVPR
jgi:hypothetical protein